MTRPNDIPQDVWDASEDHLRTYSYLLSSTEIIARSAMAERDACAVRAGNYLMTKTPLDVPRIVACEEAIRKGEAA